MSADTNKSPSRQSAEDRVEVKLRVMDLWIAEGIPWLKSDDGADVRDSDDNKLLDFYPKTVSQFALWTGSRNCATTRATLPANMATTSRTTLNQTYHDDLRERIDRKLTALHSKALEQLESANKTTILAELEADVRRLSAIVACQEKDVISFRRAASDAQRTLEEERRDNAQRLLQQASDMQSMQEEILNLSKRIRNISPR
ncbi:hypothetical protein PQR71_12030 [Paraburkholderia fungorum]|uniref:hypothetical protein n=1 Tax=Paraburkholderia fungorum TaxID=134537 RepID=UPI0038B70042